MKHFEHIASGLNVVPVMAELNAHPELWDERAGRTNENSPHYGIPDIWLRYRKPDELTDMTHFLTPHVAEFYPAWKLLPSLHQIVFDLMAKVHAVYLGGILITKVPPGKSVKPHHDRGGWHAQTMNCKVYIGLQANDRCVNHCEDESITIKTGDAVTFNNQLIHSVENNGDTDRVTAIVCMRRE